MARSVEPLVVGRVIGDVLDMFTPATEFTVHYGTKQVTNGCDIKPSAAADQPHLQILGPPVSSSLYTLVCNSFKKKIINFLTHSCCQWFNVQYCGNNMQVMVDPDAPSPSEPRLREWLHW